MHFACCNCCSGKGSKTLFPAEEGLIQRSSFLVVTTTTSVLGAPVAAVLTFLDCHAARPLFLLRIVRASFFCANMWVGVAAMIFSCCRCYCHCYCRRFHYSPCHPSKEREKGESREREFLPALSLSLSLFFSLS